MKMFQLNSNKSYFNSGNTFSRVLLMGENLGKKNLIVFDSSEDLRIFSKIWEYLGISSFYKLADSKDLLGFLVKNSGTYFATKDIFTLQEIRDYDIEKNCIKLKLTQNYNIDDLIKNLIDFGYKHSPTLSHPGTYHKMGDSLDFRDFFEEKIYKISFFGDEVDEILFKTNFDSLDYEKINNLSISNLNFIEQESKKTILDNLDIFEVNFRTFLIGLDFYEFLYVIKNKLNPIILSETPSDYSVDLNINSLEIDSLEKLSEVLKNKENKIKIYTKNVRTITNFIEYNDISGDIEIIETPASMRYLKSFLFFRHSEFISESTKIDPETSSGGRYEDDNFQGQYKEDSGSSQEGQEEEGQENLSFVILAKAGIQESEVINGNVLASQKTFLDSHFHGNDKINGFSVLYICDDLLSAIFVKKRSRKSVSKNIDLLLEIKPNDYIVHIDHGVGIFRSIILKDLGGIKREYLEIEYSENDKLFVPISELHRVSKYIGEDDPKLTRLNSGQWQKTLKKVEEDVEKVAEELLEIYAKRNIVSGYSFLSFPEKEEEFANSFKFAHTQDQAKSIKEILEDMEKSKPMDRLLVGDVGFGKTEVACNAIFRCLLNHKQAVFISPLVILAYEHYDTVIKRFAGLGYKIEIITRVEKPSRVEKVLKELSEGKVDIIIGTHRLLSEDVRFKNLGLLIIDEEHRFGVIDKEKIIKIKEKIDILSLSATPIPRSLNFALNGIKDISIISTPPPLKKPIKTFALRWSDEAIIDSIKKEFDRNGQVIFIHNRVATIDATKNYLQRIIGNKAKIIITHGQMNGIEVEDRILDFKNGKYNILLSTTVIENGVNFLNANTIIIDEADKFGLSQLHQLRGRVGRKDREGYCYLSYRNENLADDAKKRLITIVNNTHLGAGFEIAMRDLEIRGAGDILGIKQSGKSKEVGISLYIKLLEEKIEELKTGNKINNNLCQVELGISFYISDDFFSSEADKIHFFRNIESIETLEDLDFAHETFIKGNDKVSPEFENLFLILKTRIILSEYGVISLKKVGFSYIFELDKNTQVEKVKEFLDRFDKNGDFVLITVHKIKVETRFWSNDSEFLKFLNFGKQQKFILKTKN